IPYVLIQYTVGEGTDQEKIDSPVLADQPGQMPPADPEIADSAGSGKQESAERPNEGIINFVAALSNLLPVTDLKENIRITHQGLFVAEGFTDQLVQCYQGWFEKQTGFQKSQEKSKKKLFGSLQPESYYLIEGKITL